MYIATHLCLFTLKNSVLRRLLLFSLCGDTMGRSASAMKVRGASQTAFQKVRMKIRGAAQPAAKAKAKVKKCSKPSCWNNAASPRAKFCIGCFKDNARCTGARTGGNSGAKGVIGNSGNTNTGEEKRFAGMKSAERRYTKKLLQEKAATPDRRKSLLVRGVPCCAPRRRCY